MGLVEIDASDHLMAEQHLALRIGLGHRAQGDGQTVQRLADAKGVAAVAGEGIFSLLSLTRVTILQ